MRTSLILCGCLFLAGCYATIPGLNEGWELQAKRALAPNGSLVDLIRYQAGEEHKDCSLAVTVDSPESTPSKIVGRRKVEGDNRKVIQAIATSSDGGTVWTVSAWIGRKADDPDRKSDVRKVIGSHMDALQFMSCLGLNDEPLPLTAGRNPHYQIVPNELFGCGRDGEKHPFTLANGEIDQHPVRTLCSFGLTSVKTLDAVGLEPGDGIDVTFKARLGTAGATLEKMSFKAGPFGIHTIKGEGGKWPFDVSYTASLGTPIGRIVEDLRRLALINENHILEKKSTIVDIQFRLAPRHVFVLRKGVLTKVAWSKQLTLADMVRLTDGPRASGENDHYYRAVIEGRTYDDDRLKPTDRGAFFVSAYSGTYQGHPYGVDPDQWEKRKGPVYLYPNDRVLIEDDIQSHLFLDSPTVD